MNRKNCRPNILLVNPWIYDFTAYNFWLSPLGLLYVAAILRKYSKARLFFLDALNRAHPALPKALKSRPDGRGPFLKTEVAKPDVLKRVPRKYSRYGIPLDVFEAELARLPVPDAVLITSGMTYWYPGVELVVEIVRKRFGSVPIVLGGIYATLSEAHARSRSGADIVIAGPAEGSILRLMRDVLGDGAIREDDAISPFFSGLPRPAVDVLNDKTWLPVLSSRGCPYRCVFCAVQRLFPGFERCDPSDVADEIADSHRRFGTRHFAFYDDALLLDRDRHAVPLFENLAKLNLPLSLHMPIGLHVREIDRDLARVFKRAGVTSLYLSQESFDAHIIRESCPKVGEGDLERALGYLEEAGYARSGVSVYLLAGLPRQTVESVVDSIRRVRSLGAVPRLAFFSPIPGTPVWEELVRAGRVRAEMDPLLHNKLTFPYIWGEFSAEDFAAFRSVLQENRLN